MQSFGCVQQSKRQHRIIISQRVFKPTPFGSGIAPMLYNQFIRKDPKDINNLLVIRISLQVIRNTDDGIGNTPDRVQMNKVWYGIKKDQSPRLIICIIGCIAQKITQRPNRSSKCIFRSPLIQKVSSEAQKISETPVFVLHIMDIAQVDRQQVKCQGKF